MPPAMVLAAGLGTRLRPLTDACPKALVPVGDRPALAHVLARLRSAGAAPIVVNAHHRAADLAGYLGAHEADVILSEEHDLLGTAGGLEHASARLGPGDVLVWNADTIGDVDLDALARAHARWHEPSAATVSATLVVSLRPVGLGPVGLDMEGRVVRLRGERFGEESQGAEFLGISMVGAALRSRLPSRGCLVGDVWLPLLRRGGVLRSVVHEGAFFDIGTVRTYLDANMAWLGARGSGHFRGAAATVGPDVSLEGSVVGERARVTGSGALSRCVVWPGSHAVAPLADAVVFAGGVVRAAG